MLMCTSDFLFNCDPLQGVVCLLYSSRGLFIRVNVNLTNITMKCYVTVSNLFHPDNNNSWSELNYKNCIHLGSSLVSYCLSIGCWFSLHFGVLVIVMIVYMIWVWIHVNIMISKTVNLKCTNCSINYWLRTIKVQSLPLCIKLSCI